jgi:hypothetical protein
LFFTLVGKVSVVRVLIKVQKHKKTLLGERKVLSQRVIGVPKVCFGKQKVQKKDRIKDKTSYVSFCKKQDNKIIKKWTFFFQDLRRQVFFSISSACRKKRK